MKKLIFLNILETIILVLLVVVPLRTFFFEPFFVMGSSMEPYYHAFDYLIIDKLTFRLREPQRGEVIVFHPPFDQKIYYIKRIIGLPGEEVKISNGKIYINGKELKEDYFDNGVYTPGETSLVLGKDEYFVLGDNRAQSFDSRKWGPLHKKFIVGRVLIHFSLFKNLLKTTSYQ
jgi:signal peptidase I